MELNRVRLIPKLNLDQTLQNFQDLNDSINSEFSQGEEKSVSQKISDQPSIFSKSNIHTLTGLSQTHRVKNSQIYTRRNSRSLKLGVTYTRNDSTEFNSKRQRSYILSHKSNTNSEEISLNIDQLITTDKKNLSTLLRTKESELSELTKKFDKLKKKLEEKKEEVSESKTEYERVKANNQNLKILIVNLIKHKEVI